MAVDIDEKALRCGSLPFAVESQACFAYTLAKYHYPRIISRRLLENRQEPVVPGEQACYMARVDCICRKPLRLRTLG